MIATPGAPSRSRGARAHDIPLPRALLRLHRRRPEHHRQDATAEKAGEGRGYNFSFSDKGLGASFSEFGSELQKYIKTKKNLKNVNSTNLESL